MAILPCLGTRRPTCEHLVHPGRTVLEHRRLPCPLTGAARTPAGTAVLPADRREHHGFGRGAAFAAAQSAQRPGKAGSDHRRCARPGSAQAQGNEANEGIPAPTFGGQGPALADQGAAAAADAVSRGVRGQSTNVPQSGPLPCLRDSFSSRRSMGPCPGATRRIFGRWPLAVGLAHRTERLLRWDFDSAVERSWSRWRTAKNSPGRSEVAEHNRPLEQSGLAEKFTPPAAMLRDPVRTGPRCLRCVGDSSWRRHLAAKT